MGLSQHGIKAKSEEITFIRPSIILKDTLVCDKSGVFEGDVNILAPLTVTTGLIKPVQQGAKTEYMSFKVQADLEATQYFTLGSKGGLITKMWAVTSGAVVSVANKISVVGGTNILFVTFVTGDLTGAVRSNGTGIPNFITQPWIAKGGTGYIYCPGDDDNTNWLYIILECYIPGDF